MSSRCHNVLNVLVGVHKYVLGNKKKGVNEKVNVGPGNIQHEFNLMVIAKFYIRHKLLMFEDLLRFDGSVKCTCFKHTFQILENDGWFII